MRATSRGYIAGVGTTGALVAAAACAFVIVSAIVAFEGWPGAHLGLHPATLDGSVTPAADGIAPTRLGLEPAASGSSGANGEIRGSARHDAAPAAPGGGFGSGRLAGEAPVVPGGPPVTLHSGGHGGAHGAARGPATPPHDAGAGDYGVPQATPPPTTPDDPVPPPPADGTVGGTVTQVTGTVGTTVTQTGQQLGTTVSGATAQVGLVVGQVSPALGQTVTQTGQAAGGVVSGATGTVGQVVQGTGQVVGSLLGGLGGGASHPRH